MVTLPVDVYPHILDAILQHAPFASLLALRAACRPLRDRIDRLLIRHMVIYADAGPRSFGVFHDGAYRRLSRSDWIEHAELTGTIRPVAAVNYGMITLGICRCAEYHEIPSESLMSLAKSLRGLEVVRVWNDHGWPASLGAPRSINFSTKKKKQFEAYCIVPRGAFGEDTLEEHYPAVERIVLRVSPKECRGCETEHCFVLLLDEIWTGIRHTLDRYGSMTLVGFENWLDGPDPEVGDYRANLTEELRWWLQNDGQIPKRVDEFIDGLTFLSMNEQIKSVGEEYCALEVYRTAPPRL